MSISELPIQINQAKINQFCLSHGITRLSLFGSVLRNDFKKEISDVDVWAEFAPGALTGLGLRYVRLAQELSEVIGYPIDLCSHLHPALLEQIKQERLVIYG